MLASVAQIYEAIGAATGPDTSIPLGDESSTRRRWRYDAVTDVWLYRLFIVVMRLKVDNFGIIILPAQLRSV